MDRRRYLALLGCLLACGALAAALVRPSPTSRWPARPAHRFYSPSGERVALDYVPRP